MVGLFGRVEQDRFLAHLPTGGPKASKRCIFIALLRLIPGTPLEALGTQSLSGC
jgi:hypothetical protein